MTELNYTLLSSAILCKILESADVETPNNRATAANDFSNSFINRSASLALTELAESLPADSPPVARQVISCSFGAFL